jgi:hypothetical protein
MDIYIESINIYEFGVRDVSSQFRINATIGTTEIGDMQNVSGALAISGPFNEHFVSYEFRVHSAYDALIEYNRNPSLKTECCAIIFLPEPDLTGKCICYYVRKKISTNAEEFKIEYRNSKSKTWALILTNNGLPYCMSQMCSTTRPKIWDNNSSTCEQLAGLYCGMTTKHLKGTWCYEYLKFRGSDPTRTKLLTDYCRQVLTPEQAQSKEEQNYCGCYHNAAFYDKYFQSLDNYLKKAKSTTKNITHDPACAYRPCVLSDFKKPSACPAVQICAIDTTINGSVSIGKFNDKAVIDCFNTNRGPLTLCDRTIHQSKQRQNKLIEHRTVSSQSSSKLIFVMNFGLFALFLFVFICCFLL